MNINIKKFIMILHKDREVRFKCNIFCRKAKNEDIYFKCKKSMIAIKKKKKGILTCQISKTSKKIKDKFQVLQLK